MRIREYQESDISDIVSLFYETVYSINAVDYTSEQLNAWAPKEEKEDKLESWNESLHHNITYVAELNDKIIGFSDMTHNGYLDRLYTHKDYQGQGVATALVNKLEAVASKMSLSEIFTEASVTAKPFFEQRGYQIIRSQKVKRKGITMPNFQMSKKLASE